MALQKSNVFLFCHPAFEYNNSHSINHNLIYMQHFINWWLGVVGAEPLTISQYKKVEARINLQVNAYVFVNDLDSHKIIVEAPTEAKAKQIINRLKFQKKWKLQISE